MEEVVIPEGVQSLESHAFSRCYNLKRVALPRSLRCIDSYAFEDCFKLEELSLPEGLERIESLAFRYTSLKRLECLSSHFVVEHGALYTADKSELVYVCGDVEHLELPASVRVIRDDTIQIHRKLKRLILPSGLTKLGYDALCRCTALTELHLPEGLIDLGPDNFYGFVSLREIYIPKSLIDSLLSKGQKMPGFGGCDALEHIYVPEGYEEACRKILRPDLHQCVSPMPMQ